MATWLPGVAALDVDREALIREGKTRSPRALKTRELAVELSLGAAFLIVATVMAFILPAGHSVSWEAALVGLAVYVLASRVGFDVGAGYATAAQLSFVPLLFILPPSIVPLAIAGASLVGQLGKVLTRRTHVDRIVFAATNSWFAIGSALVLSLAPVKTVTLVTSAILVGALASQFAIDLLVSAIRERLAFDVPFSVQARVLGLVYLVDLFLAPLGLLVAFSKLPMVIGVLLPVPLVILLNLFGRERSASFAKALELSEAYHGTALLLGDVVEADDAYTGSHSRDVVELAQAVGHELGLDADQCRRLEFAALLHDVGKIRISNEIINKPGALTDAEWEVIKTHTIEGEEILKRVGGLLGEVGTIVRSCHERWDGGGYPDGLAGTAIPIEARIVFCCDAFNAMTTTRSYRKGRPVGEAIAELRQNAGSQFCPQTVEALERVVSSEGVQDPPIESLYVQFEEPHEVAAPAIGPPPVRR